jgi:hypothetical protein
LSDRCRPVDQLPIEARQAHGHANEVSFLQVNESSP